MTMTCTFLLISALIRLWTGFPYILHKVMLENITATHMSYDYKIHWCTLKCVLYRLLHEIALTITFYETSYGNGFWALAGNWTRDLPDLKPALYHQSWLWRRLCHMLVLNIQPWFTAERGKYLTTVPTRQNVILYKTRHTTIDKTIPTN